MNRQKTFDRVKQTTLEVLKKPSVIEVLGEKAVSYSQMAQGAFLPEFIDGSLHLPADQLLQDNLAIVPYKRGANKTANINQFLQWPRLIDYLHEANNQNYDFSDQYQRAHQAGTGMRTGLQNAVAMTIVGDKSKYPIINRPIIFISSIVNKEPDDLVGADLIHELCHVENAGQNFGDKEILTKDRLPHPEAVVDVAYQEKLAYAVGFKVLKACGVDTIEITKNNLKGWLNRCNGKDAGDCIDEHGKYIKRYIDRQYRAIYKKPFFKGIPAEVKSVAINEVFGINEHTITDEEIAAYASVGIIRSRQNPIIRTK